MNETIGDHGTSLPSNETSVIDQYSERESQILLRTLYSYGSFYLASLVVFCLLRKRICPRLFNVRSWIPALRCDLAMIEYGYVSWIWQVFKASDDDILDQCGMDALCYLRILRFGRKIALFASFHAIWLMSIYGTAPKSPETSYLTDWMDIISISHVPSSSPILLGTVLAANMVFIYTMYLINKEFEWYTKCRHKFLMKRHARNYAVYVSGIPEAYQSSYAILEYFGQCSSNSSVLEAHITWDLPQLEKKASHRETTIKKLEHAYALERKKGTQVTHYEFSKEGFILRKVPTVAKYETKLDKLNKDISESIDKVLNINHTLAIYGMRQYSNRQMREYERNPLRGTFWLDNPALSIFKSGMMDLENNHGAKESSKIPLAGFHNCKIEGVGKTTTGNDSYVADKNQVQKDSGTNSFRYSDVPGDRSGTSSVDDDNSSTATFYSAVENVQIESGTNPKTNKVWRFGGTVKRRAVNARGSIQNATEKVGEVMKKQAEAAGEYGVGGIIMATEYGKVAAEFGTSIVTSAAAIVPMQYFKFADGNPREAGFVVFSDLYATHAALQMIHHPAPYSMEVSEAPAPEDIFWRNVGLPARAKRTGVQLSFAATTVLCIFWTVPVTTIASLAKVGSLKQTLPFLEEWIEVYPSIETILAQLAPLLLIMLDSGILPLFLRTFTAWEGHVAIPSLEASLFLKRAAFIIIQTFFVSAISGRISDAITTILNNPDYIIDFLANSLPAQSTYFLQLLLINACLIQALELLRVTPLVMALVRLVLGPNLTEKERKSTWCSIRPLEDPRFFHQSDMLPKVIFMFMILFVYATIAPITTYFLAVSFIMMEFCYRYQFYHNYPIGPDSGGQLWKGFIRIILVCMIIAQLTLIGQLMLKRSTLGTPFLGPIIAITVLFIIYIHAKHFYVAKHLPSRECNEVDRKNYDKGLDYFDFVRGKYLQPCLQNRELYPEECRS